MDRICETDPYYPEMKRHKELAERYLAIADADYGVPKICPCGGRIIEEASTEPALGRRYFRCNVYKNDGFHFRKCWVLAIEEEVTMLRKEVDEQSLEIRRRSNHEFQIKQMRLELEKNAEEIAKLKEIVATLVGRI